jgi:hypothetical protein
LISLPPWITLDQINAGFEMAGAISRTFDCVQLYRAKRFVGGSLFTAFFFLMWGFFNIVFYPSLGQTYSYLAALALTTMNALWLVMAMYFNWRIARKKGEQDGENQRYIHSA